jgi:hypothetical protein
LTNYFKLFFELFRKSIHFLDRFIHNWIDFIELLLALDDMTKKIVAMHDKMKMTKEEAEAWANKTLPSLKRWKKKEKGCGCCCHGH